MRGVVVLGVLLLVHTATGTVSALGNTNCKTLKNSKTNNGNLNANQCSKVTYDEIHHCACEDDTDCTWGGPGTNSAWANNLVCCRPATATSGSNYALGRCIDVTSEHCCQFEYGTSNNPGYVVQALVTTTKPRCCARRVPIGFGTTNIRPAYLSTPLDFQFTDCSCTADSDCNEGAPYCCSNRCSATTCACTADSDCTGNGQICCSTGNADANPKRCVSTDKCCVFNHYINNAGENYRRNWKKIFDPETQACCPYGSVVRVLSTVNVASGVQGSGLSISDDSFGLADIDGVFIYTRATNALRRCRCTGSTGAAANGRLATGPTTSGCSEGETCCELTGDMINTNWMVTRLSSSLFDSVQCDPEKPHCLDSCMGMCSSKCEASCIGALLYPNAGTGIAAKYQILAPENLRCCRFETAKTRVLPLSDSATTTTQNKRFETSYYTPTLEKSGSALVRQYCCTYDGVRSTDKNKMPSCNKCYVDSDCTANGEITYAGSENLRCCGADQENSKLGSCIDSRTEHCCVQGTDTLPSSESVSSVLANDGQSDCSCTTDADCPEAVTDGPSWGCCIKPGDEKGICFTSETRQCCGGIVISWESYCCATAAQLAVGDAKEFTRSAADRRWSPTDANSQCPCNDAADCAGITFEGAVAPGTWECCAPGDDECGLCYNTEEEQCCTAGPAALAGKIMVANGVTLMTSSFKPFSEMCCKLTGPAPQWTRAAQSDRGRSGVSAGTTTTAQLGMRGANGGDPVNDCLCKTDEDCAEGYKCCHLTHDNPAHLCDAKYLYGKASFFASTDSHCSGRCINPEFQSCCGNREKNAGVVCYNKYEKCCGEDTEQPTCCNKLSQTCKTGPDDRFIFNDDAEKAVCTTIEHNTPGRTMIAIVFPIFLALVLIVTFVFAALQAIRQPSQLVMVLICVGLGILILIFCILLCFSPLWKFSVVVVASMATVLTALNKDTGNGTCRMAGIVAVVSILFIVDPFVGNAAMSMHYYVGDTLTEGALHTAQALYLESCTEYYGFFSKDPRLADYREQNSDATRYGMCAIGWAQALIVIVGLLVPFHLAFVTFGLIAIGFKERNKDNRIATAQ